MLMNLVENKFYVIKNKDSNDMLSLLDLKSEFV